MNKILYASSESDADEHPPTKKAQLKVIPNPTVELAAKEYKLGKEMVFNIPQAELLKEKQGPMNPFHVKKERNMQSGHAEDYYMNDSAFYQLTRQFENKGYTQIDDVVVENPDRLQAKQNSKRKREAKGNASDSTFKGPWAAFEGDVYKMPERPEETFEPDPEFTFDRSKLESVEAKPKFEEKSILHGKEEFDYLGRSFIHPPSNTGVDLSSLPGSQECFIPKKLIHTWTGHTKGVNTIKFFPRSGHMLLSGSMDMKMKLWDVYRERQVRRTYSGHTKGIKDACFNYNGEKFLSASYDKFYKQWDTETGFLKFI
jgi:pre-mRNA-processing factor 17